MSRGAENACDMPRGDPPSNTVLPALSIADPTWTLPAPADRTLAHVQAAAPEPLPPDNLPSHLCDHPRYRVIGHLGHGGMGDVFLAEHRLMGRRVALKTIRLGMVDAPHIFDRFLREIRATAKLSHPNIVVAHDAEATPDFLFLVVEFLEGRDLRSIVMGTGRLDPTTACDYVYQAALALDHAHRRGVIHRDIKPGNLFLVPGELGAAGVVKVLDFGLAKVAGEAFPGAFSTPAGYAMGTRGFMSPEQSTDARAVGVHADVFSLGRTLYFLLSGQNPYPNRMHSWMEEEAGHDPVAPIDKVRPGVPAEVMRIMRKMSARRSEDRYQSCAEVVAALAEIRPSASASRTEPKRRWWQIWQHGRAAPGTSS